MIYLQIDNNRHDMLDLQNKTLEVLKINYSLITLFVWIKLIRHPFAWAVSLKAPRFRLPVPGGRFAFVFQQRPVIRSILPLTRLHVRNPFPSIPHHNTTLLFIALKGIIAHTRNGGSLTLKANMGGTYRDVVGLFATGLSYCMRNLFSNEMEPIEMKLVNNLLKANLLRCLLPRDSVG